MRSFSFNGEPILESDFHFDADTLSDGTYTLEATDVAGNSSKIFIIIDKTAPTGEFSAEKIETENGSFFTSSVKFTWAETDCTATLNGEPYKKGATIYADGSYTLVLTDLAGNSTTYTFGMLLSEPNTTIVILPTEDGEEAEEVESVAGRTYAYSKPVSVATASNATVYINGQAIEQNTTLSEPGDYRIVIKNAANVEKEFTITILKTEVAEEERNLKAADVILIIVFAAAIVGISVLIVKNIVKAKKIRTKRL